VPPRADGRPAAPAFGAWRAIVAADRGADGSKKRRKAIVRNAIDVVDGVVDYLKRNATTARDDRLFPTDLSVIETDPLSVACGAAGVIFALT
jgi:hypothetical protein